MQSACSEQLSAVSAFERVHGTDICHGYRSHSNLTVFLLEDHVSSSKCSSQFQGMRGPITCSLLRTGKINPWCPAL